MDNRNKHIDALLDQALEETFPASDAVCIDIEQPPGLSVTYGSENGPKIEKA
jgi:hypothetical protein